ncbi:MAG TPA: amino acid deaminase [Pseudonocardia sp.]|jgi:D-serine deaminase-like pyridoxal phosphate-dependent protein|nr:amino acid deaminase [Pseudonocardia sp.]
MTADGALLTARDKGLPERAVGRTVRAFLAERPRLGEFWTPLVVLDDDAMRSNVATMAAWCRERGLEIMPHGKTTMAPALWRRQLDAGALGITLATMGQVRTARSLGVDSIMLANAVVDAGALAYLAGELADPGLRFVCWADSPATVEAMERGLRQARPARPIDVCVELGAAGGRTGARTVADGIAVAERIAASDVLRLAGVAGYEGSLGHDRSSAVLAAVRAYLASMLALHRAVEHLYDAGEVYVTAGGSAYFDLVAEAFAAGAGEERTRFTLRSGAYIVHDDGFYRQISPFDEAAAGPDTPRFRVAMRGIARVVSQPEPGLALLDGGKRDFPFDEGLPIPRLCAADLAGPWRALSGAEVSALNDQHTFLRLADAAATPVGSVVALGLSHPCTTFDKWRVLPVVESAASDVVVDLVRTYF